MTKTLCFTGHRPEKLGGYESNPIQDWARDRLADAIYRSFHKGFIRFICGGALGADWVAAEEVLDLKENYPEAKLILALPFKGYNSKWPSWLIEKFENQILEKADKVNYISSPPYAPWKMQARNEFMIKESDAIIAIWNGSHEGGTFNAVQYALSLSKPTYQIDPIDKTEKWLEIK